MNNLPDQFRCYSCGATGETTHDENWINVYCVPCDASTFYGPVGSALYRAQQEQRIRRHLEETGHHDLVRHIDEHGIQWEEAQRG